ncbi:probable ATP-dependent RNA helicase DDX10 [Protobothrops mucrosquamatus]|uniref:probable ATP-dependent RNA helicase DDX10 n=1 Tax=Protobothrops mucrosquamatus TaxID=103944 RepID=UPI0007756F41|nr:probable ATP-dependent RNA helicase DDX10 [Protobothrops mucrosquamatus]
MEESRRVVSGSGADPVRNFERWKKRYAKRKDKQRQQRKQKKPEWEVERESIAALERRYTEINTNDITRFSDFPLSRKTLKGLQEAQYRMVTEIQKQTIGLALQGKDVLGAAKTGSGKTLAFIVPALEILYRQQWTAMDELGVLIISPTRELAYQTFEVLRKVGKNHEFSAGLIIGGKDLKQESTKIHNMNILICTPGRLLQHMDETSYFHASNLQMLILDEADRILDMGFADTMNAIIENLPKKRQTLLFSATQTKSVKDLARLSLKDPEYIWVHEKAKFSTPATLEQNYIVCELHQKVNMLYSFLKTHLNKKSIVFFASCKEVQYLFRVFCRLRPGLPILALHGKQQQMKRMEVYQDFLRKKSAVLFATDLAARGLDFPAVNWVIQVDCPEDANTYIHRVGRTARYKEGGEALLVLLPSEENGMIQQLSQKKVPVSNIKINPEKLLDVQKKLQSLLAQDQDLKERAQRCFVSYLRSVYLMKNKEVFDVLKLSIAEYALSLGLAVAPRVRFLQKVQKKMHTMEPEKEGTEQAEDTQFSLSDEDLEKCRRIFSRTGMLGQKETEGFSGKSSPDEEALQSPSELEEFAKVHESKPESLNFFGDDDDDDDDNDNDASKDVLIVKRRNVFGLESEEKAPLVTQNVKVKKKITKTKEAKKVLKRNFKVNTKIVFTEDGEVTQNVKVKKKITKTKEAKKVLKRNFKVNTKIVFTEDGELIQQWPPAQKSTLEKEEDGDDCNGINLDKAKERLQEEDKFDKEEYRKKIKEKHREKRLKEKAARREARKMNAKIEEDTVALLDHSDSDEEFDPSTLPDPDGPKDEEQEILPKSHSKRGMDKRQLDGSKSEGETPQKRKKMKPNQEGSFLPLDTGLSLAEDEALVLQLLNN